MKASLLIFLFAFIILAVELKAQNNEVIKKASQCKVIKEWADSTQMHNNFQRINYHVEFFASEQNDCGNLILTVSLLKSASKTGDEKVINIKLAWKTTEASNCRDSDTPLFDTSRDKMKIGQDDEIITDDKGFFEIHEVEPHKYRLQDYTREGSFMEGTVGKFTIYTCQF